MSGMMTSAVLLKGGPVPSPGPLPSDVLRVLESLPYVLLVGGVLFGMLVAAVRLSRSGSPWRRAVATLFGLAFLLVGIFAVSPGRAPANSLGVLIGVAWVVSVGAAATLLVVAIAVEPGSSMIARLVGLSQIITVGSIVLGALGIIGWTILDAPVQAIAQGGIRDGDFQRIDQLLIWTALRDRGPMIASLLAATLGALVWRVAGQARGAAATLLGCMGLGLNLWLLFLQTGD